MMGFLNDLAPANGGGFPGYADLLICIGINAQSGAITGVGLAIDELQLAVDGLALKFNQP